MAARQIVWHEVLAGEKAFNTTGELAARRDARRLPRVPGRHQGTAHHARRRRHPLAERRPAPGARPLRLPAAGALLPGRADAGQAARAGRHGDLPREHRRHLRRHRVRRGHAGGREAEAVAQGRVPEAVQRRSASRTRSASASSRCRARAPSGWCAPRSSTRSPTSARA